MRIRRELRFRGDVTAYLLEAGGPGGGMKPLQLQLKGDDQAVLTRLADSIAKIVRGTPGAVDVGLSTKGEKPELKVSINRGLAGGVGVTVGQIAQSLRPGFAGGGAGNWVDPGRATRYVRVRLPACLR